MNPHNHNGEHGPASGKQKNTGSSGGKGLFHLLREGQRKIKPRTAGHDSQQQLTCHVCGWVMADSRSIINTSEYELFCPICGNPLEVEV